MRGRATGPASRPRSTSTGATSGTGSRRSSPTTSSWRCCSRCTRRSAISSSRPSPARAGSWRRPPITRSLSTPILRIAPDAAVVFLVRDPRDTVRSLLEASDESWGDWAPKSVEDATALWLRSVRAWFPVKRDPRLLLVRYEDLRADPAELERVADVPRARQHVDMAANARSTRRRGSARRRSCAATRRPSC